jgi:hypothetical protein
MELFSYFPMPPRRTGTHFSYIGVIAMETCNLCCRNSGIAGRIYVTDLKSRPEMSVLLNDLSRA